MTLANVSLLGRVHAPAQRIARDRVVLSVCLATALATGGAGAQSHTALDFDGKDDYVEMGGPLNFNAPFTVEAWVYARSGVGGGRILSNRDGSGGYEIDVNFDGLSTVVRFTFDGIARAVTSFQPYLNTWTHVAGTWAGPTGAPARDGGGGTVTLYINGTPVSSGSQSADLAPSAANFVLGKFSGSSFGFFDGRVDEVRVWGATLDGATVAEWMHSHVTPDHPDYAALVASWRLDEGSGQIVESEVGGAPANGRLGSEAGEDDADPTWAASDVVPSRETSVGALKARYRH
jgi:hypothetical protein